MVNFTRNDRLHFTDSATLLSQLYTLPEMIGYTLLAALTYTGTDTLYQKW